MIYELFRVSGQVRSATHPARHDALQKLTVTGSEQALSSVSQTS